MKAPTFLKAILVSWLVYYVITLLSILFVLVMGINALLVTPENNPPVMWVALVLGVILGSGLNIYLLKRIFDLWKGRDLGTGFLRFSIALSLLSFPIGTSLAVMTLLCLADETVKQYLNKGIPVMTKERLIEEVNALKAKS